MAVGCMVSCAGHAIQAQTSPFDDVAKRMTEASMQQYSEGYNLAAEEYALKAESTPADPEVEFEYLFPQSSGELNRWSLGVSQELPNIWKVRAARQTASAISNLNDLRFQEAVEAEYFKSEQLIIRIIAAKKQIKLYREIAGNAKSLTEKYQLAYQKGEATVLDVNKLKIEYARMISACEAAEGELAALVAQVVAASGDQVPAANFEAISDYPARELLPYDDYMSALNNSASLRADDSDFQVSQLRQKLDTKDRIPSLSLGYVHAYEDGNHFNGFSAALSLPVFSRHSAVLSATYSAMAKAGENDARQTDRIATLDADYQTATALKKQLDLLGPVIETTDNMRLLKMALDGGQITLMEYIQETNYFLEATQDYLDARKEYALVLSSLNRYSNHLTK